MIYIINKQTKYSLSMKHLSQYTINKNAQNALIIVRFVNLELNMKIVNNDKKYNLKFRLHINLLLIEFCSNINPNILFFIVHIEGDA